MVLRLKPHRTTCEPPSWLPWHYPQVELLYGVGEGGKYHTDTYAFGLGTGLRVSGQFWLKNGHTH